MTCLINRSVWSVLDLLTYITYDIDIITLCLTQFSYYF